MANKLNNELATAIAEKLAPLFKELKQSNSRVLTLEQGCEYLGYAKSYVYKLTMDSILPYSKPNGKSIFFDRELLEQWMLSNPNKVLKNLNKK